ncbi:MAG: hypothetical protein P4L84_21545 [Isosphaeraceae bacterium]|nr:hypothetical protein [Isosphaeraceae bacterium]
MSSSEPVERIPLLVRAADDATELFVLDGKLNLVARGLGRLEGRFEPGIYKVKARSGYVTEERRVVLTGPQPWAVSFGPLEFASPALLVSTAQTHEYQMAAAERESGQVHESLAKEGDSLIFIFARRWTGSPSQELSAGKVNPAEGLSFHYASGRRAVDLRSVGNVDLTGDPWAACTIRVNSGLYRLRLTRHEGPALEQTVVACPGWQTQVFLQQYPHPSESDQLYADLTSASILMARSHGPGSGQPVFHARDPAMRLAEQARLGLANGRQVLADSVVREILDGKFDNPLLGLFGAHLLLQKWEADQQAKRSAGGPVADRLGGEQSRTVFDEYLDGLYGGGVTFQTIVENLRRLLGHGTHPDVEALALLLDPSGGGYRFQAPPTLRRNRRGKLVGAHGGRYRFEIPPMLRRSWALVVAATAEHPELVPEGSLASQIAERLWGEEPWLVWMKPPVKVELGDEGEPDEFEIALRHQMERFPASLHYSSLRDAPTRSESQHVGSEVVDALAAHPALEVGPAPAHPALSPEAIAGLVRTLGLPRTSVERLVRKISDSDFQHSPR